MARDLVLPPRPVQLPLELWCMIMEFLCWDELIPQDEDSLAIAARLLSLRTTCTFMNAALLMVLRLRLKFYNIYHFARYLRTLIRYRNGPVDIGRMCDTLLLRDADLWSLDFLEPGPDVNLKAGLAELSHLRKLEVQWSPTDRRVLLRLSSFSRLEELKLLPAILMLDELIADTTGHVYQDTQLWSRALAQLKALRRLEILSTEFFPVIPANVYYKERQGREIELIQSWTSDSALLTCIVLGYRILSHPPMVAEAFWRVGRFERTVQTGWECKGGRNYRALWYNTVNSYTELPMIKSLLLD